MYVYFFFCAVTEHSGASMYYYVDISITILFVFLCVAKFELYVV